jgi:hypothetical protein
MKIALGLLHLDEHARLPDQVGEGGPTVAPARDALLQRRAGLAHATVTKGTKETVEEDLRLALLVAGEVFAPVPDELVKPLA